MKLFQKKTRVILMLALGAMILSGCGQKQQRIQKMDTAMGTIVNQTLYVSGENAESASREVISCIQELEEKYLSWRLETAEIHRINATAGSGQEMVVSDFLSDVLERCNKIYEASGGAFDFSLGSLTRLWNIDKWAVEESGFVPPAEKKIAEVLEALGADKCKIDGNTVQLPANLQLDLGAVGKGIALDEIRKILEQRDEITGGVISVGGSILTYGSKPDGGNWNVGIVNPADTSQNIGVLQLGGGWCVSTSGDYERYVEAQGMRYHHILNPHTGKPADSGVRSVTILTRNGLDSDALSTACFVLGAEKGRKLAEVFEAEALFVLNNGEILMTEGMKQYFCLSNGEK